MSNTKLELTWIGKDTQPRVEPRILIEDKEKSYGDENSENMLIHGDNLLALKALEDKFTNKIKCIYIDPPYNTGSAFEHYDDNLEHSTWLNLMSCRLKILKNLLKDDEGTIWISIDADESHYLKVLCDEIFGRNNFIDEVVWQRAYSPINLKKTLSRAHDIILVYAKNKTAKFELNKLPRNETMNSRYKNLDNDPRGEWKSSDLSVGPAVESNIYEITTPSGRKVLPPKGYSWRLSKDRFEEYVKENRIWFGPDGNNVPSIKRFLTEVKQGITPMTWWTREEVGDNQEAKREIKALNIETEEVFETPKPERLIERILTIGSNEGDFVLDSFLGSGTTCAVAHKMKRKWIGIEMGNHCYTYCKQRVDKVIDGKDDGGITKSQNWQGGGGYKFYELAPSLLVKDKFNNWVISENYNGELLTRAICKQEKFDYSPEDNYYWKQGKSSENDYIYVTTNYISLEYLQAIREEMQSNESLLICCKSYQEECKDKYDNITIKKIPQSILNNCEYGRDDYSLNVEEVLEVKEDE